MISGDRPVRHEELMSSVREEWDRSSSNYDNLPAHGRLTSAERDVWLQLLEAFLPPSKKQRILDVGTGTGFFALLLASLGHDVTGVDISPKMLDVARQNAAVSRSDIAFEEVDIHALPFERHAFDAVVSRHVLWTLADPVRAISSWSRVTRPGGIVLAVDGYWQPFGRMKRLLASANRAVKLHQIRLRQPREGPQLEPYRPLMGVRDTTAAQNAFARAGLVNVRAETLPWVDAVERRAMSPWERMIFESNHYLVEGTVPNK